MEIITRAQLSAQKNTYLKTKTFSSLNESINLHKRRSSLQSEVTIFLSHKHGETNDIENAIALLTRHNVHVYVDWNDQGMPASTSGATAVRLKESIRKCRKFILLATEAAIASKWCNWELGLGDAHKYIEHIAIIPIKSESAAYSGTEYLQIYPSIGKKNWYQDEYVVKFPSGREISLESWLRS